MRLALVALALALPVAGSAEAPSARPAAKVSAPARICSDAMGVRNAASPGPPQLKRLDELPPGNLTLTVVNRVGDCIEPVVVGQPFGAVEAGRGR
ncbi:MAG: hypothetical protein QOG72_3003 [Sphingomonadales bacterium]|jgi:hypothetical protein|nr:hypothetical protein [Sphingomonadales bacterium]